MTKTELLTDLGRRHGIAALRYHRERRAVRAKADELGVGPFAEHTHPETAHLWGRAEASGGAMLTIKKIADDYMGTRHGLASAFYKAHDKAYSEGMKEEGA